jgi:glucose-6-phosphate dehydrogenase assembly protein OpcA
MPEFREIAAMAGKVVFDSAAAPDTALILQRARDAAGRGVMLGDLSWTILTRWREMLSQVFENQQNAAHIPRITKVDLDWGGPRYVPALYLGAWIRDSLAAVGVIAQLRISRAADTDLLRVRLTGEGIAVQLERENDRMVVTLNGSSQCTNLPHPTDYLLMREELGIVRHDTVFEKTLASAAQLAHPLQP